MAFECASVYHSESPICPPRWYVPSQMGLKRGQNTLRSEVFLYFINIDICVYIYTELCGQTYA